MKSICIPHFTAEASLAVTRGRYSSAGKAAPDRGGAIIPQFSWCYTTYVGFKMNPMKRCCVCSDYTGACVCRTLPGPTLFPPDVDPVG
jgi:hypothetical protein